MKKSFLIRAAAATFMLAAVFFGAGCKQNDDDSNESSDATVVAAVKSALDVGYATGDSATSVTQDVTLVTTNSSYTAVTIAWSSDNPTVITTAGKVTLQSADTAVTLTATITSGSASDKKTFALTVIGKAAAEVKKVAAAKTALAVTYADGDSASSVTQNVTLTTTSGDVTIAWSSDTTDVIANDGTVTLPASDTQVTLTATLTCGSSSDTKTFALTVINKTTAETLKALVITYATGDSASSVTQNVTLPTTLSSYTVTWESNHTKNITTAGVVTRDIADVSVTLTATVKDGTTTIATKEFVLTVKQIAQVTYTYTSSERTITTKYTFTSDTITYAYTNSSNSSENKKYTYTFTADTDTGTLTATMTGITINGMSYTKDTYTTYLTNGNAAYVNFFKTIYEDSDVTYDDLISGAQACNKLVGDPSDEASVAEWLYRIIYGKDKTITDYAAALKAKTTLTVDSHKAFTSLLTQMGYSSWDDALADMSAQAKTQAEDMFSTKTYSYTLVTTTYTTCYTDGYEFNTNKVYDTTKSWWEQSNNYPYYTGSGADFGYSEDIGWHLYYSDNGSYSKHSGTLSDDHTTFTETTSSKAWAITSDGQGTLTLTNGSTSYTVTFEGNELGSN